MLLNHQMIPGTSQTRYLVVAFLVLLTASCNNSESPRDYGDEAQAFEADFSSYSDEERTFIYKATTLQGKIRKGHITAEEFRQIYNTHKQWLEDIKKIYRETPSRIPTDTKSIDEIIESQFEKDRAYPRLDFRHLNLQWANLVGQDLRNSIVSGSEYTNVEPKNRPQADLRDANLIGVYAKELKADKTLLYGALLLGSDFLDSDFSNAVLSNTDLRWATFRRSRLTNAKMSGANVEGMVFEPLADALPEIRSIAGARGLEKLKYERDPAALVELRDAFDESGFHKQARYITHAIWLTERRKLSKGTLLGKIESWIYFILFEIPSSYGMSPYRPLGILVLLIPMFSISYIFATYRQGTCGIWANRLGTAVNKRVLEKWVRIRYRTVRPAHIEHLRILRICLYFGFISAFRIGFNQFDIGNWITRLQSSPYDLRATGWVRSVSGWQSLISLYLLSLSIFCLIGRPFG